MHPVVLLGPQRFEPTIAEVLDRLDLSSVVAVTAGWQEREQEVDELRDHIHRDLVNLRIYERSEHCLVEDPELAAALHLKHRRLRRLQELYRIRLKHTLAAARELMQQKGRRPFVSQHRSAAVSAVRALDRQHLATVRRIHVKFADKWRPLERRAVAFHHHEIAKQIEASSAVAVAGGHVAILLNRMRLFGLTELLKTKPVIAWSAGAMALSARVVLFHDSPAQGAGDAELLDAGLGIAAGVVALPHATRRLNLDDPVRVALMARRFAPDLMALLEPQTELVWDGERWEPIENARALSSRGKVVTL